MHEFVLYFMKFTRNYAMQRREFALDQLNVLCKVKTTIFFHTRDSGSRLQHRTTSPLSVTNPTFERAC